MRSAFLFASLCGREQEFAVAGRISLPPFRSGLWLSRASLETKASYCCGGA